MRKLKILLIAGIVVVGHQLVSAQEVYTNNKLEKTWEVNTGLDVVESSHYNAFDNTIYASNIVGKHNVIDGVGYISKLDLKGKVIEKEWVRGLNAPKGIDCSKSRLYVTDIDRVLEIDIETGAILKDYRNTKSKSLNDVSIASNGRVFISDSDGNCIFYLGSDSLEVFMESDQLNGMNGILAKGELLYLGSKGNFISVNQTTKEIKILMEKVGYLDGVEQVSDNTFVTSDWKGTVQLIELGKGVEKLIDSSAANIYAADLGYISSERILLVPTFTNNKLVAYRLR